MKHTTAERSHCPINLSLETFGDPWSLLIVRDIVYFGKKTFGEFLSSGEGMARNILTDRLVQLQAKGLLVKKPHPLDGRKEVYELTDDGLDLIPILLDLAEWGSRRAPPDELPQDWLQRVRMERETLIPQIQDLVRKGGSIFG